MNTPDERRQVETKRRIVQHKFLPILTVISQHVAAPMDGHKKLLEFPVSMFAADFVAWDAIDKSTNTWRKAIP